MPGQSSEKIKKACDRCGTCCRQGGPALHVQDRHLVAPGFLEFDVLVTIRRGELARYPLSGHPEPVRQELIKIQGQGGGLVLPFSAGGIFVLRHIRQAAAGLPAAQVLGAG